MHFVIRIDMVFKMEFGEILKDSLSLYWMTWWGQWMKEGLNALHSVLACDSAWVQNPQWIFACYFNPDSSQLTSFLQWKCYNRLHKAIWNGSLEQPTLTPLLLGKCTVFLESTHVACLLITCIIYLQYITKN